MNSKILATAIGLSLLSWAMPTQAQQQPDSQIESLLQQLPSRIEQLKEPSRVRPLQKLVQEEPLLYLLLQLDRSELPNLQQLAEDQIRQTLR